MRVARIEKYDFAVIGQKQIAGVLVACYAASAGECGLKAVLVGRDQLSDGERYALSDGIARGSGKIILMDDGSKNLFGYA